jgi:DNA-binding LacI/PurR family transcriptional regulator
MGADFELLLTNDLITKTEIQERCEAANVILLTSIQYNSPNVNVDFISAMKSRKTIIALSDPYLEQFDNYIALDNYAVGEFAARTLQLAGCQRPVFITTGFSNMMFHKRFYGFYDSMQRIGIDVPKEFPRTGPLHFIEGRKRELLNAINRGCDGAFIVSDEGIDFITHDLFSQNLIPDKFKLITLNGKGEAMLCNPPITCVNHATAGVTEILLNYLKVISKNINPPCIKKLVQPDLYLSETIGKIDIDLLERKAW